MAPFDLLLSHSFMQTHGLMNEDGSYYSESQLIATTLELAVTTKCDVLTGYMIYWEFRDPYCVVTQYEMLTQEELEERGWLQANIGMSRCQGCTEIAWQDPTQLESNKEWVGYSVWDGIHRNREHSLYGIHDRCYDYSMIVCIVWRAIDRLSRSELRGEWCVSVECYSTDS